MFFDGFTLGHLDTPTGRIRFRQGGAGPPLLLLHGNPQTHAMWHRVAPELARRYTVIAPDLRGYGGSFKPPASRYHAPYSKSVMARDMVTLMNQLGHNRFQLVAHDRGARVAHRLALDHQDSVQKLALLDIIPTLEHFERAGMSFALGYYHWFWLAQPHPIPETLINTAPEKWFHGHTARDTAGVAWHHGHTPLEPAANPLFHPEALADYLLHIKDPGTIRGICEDYRAAVSIDLVHDREARVASQKVQCPLLVLWGLKGKIAKWYDPLPIWRGYAAGPVSGGGVNSGHYLAEEAPDEVLDWLNGFLD